MTRTTTAPEQTRGDDGSLPPLGDLARIIGLRVLLPVLGWLVVLVGVGWLLSNPLADTIAGEDRVPRDLAASRTPAWNDATHVMSSVANTGTIIITTASACLVIWLITRRLREVLALAVGVTGQAIVFLLTTLAIARDRPEVPKLDVSPPTSSFPSGHTGAASALYFGLVILCWTLLRSRGPQLLALLFALVPLLVASARVYRGMHHVSDVTFGLLNGLVCATIAYLALGSPRSPAARAARHH